MANFLTHHLKPVQTGTKLLCHTLALMAFSCHKIIGCVKKALEVRIYQMSPNVTFYSFYSSKTTTSFMERM